MALDFPNSPTAGDTFTASNKTWVYADGKWALQPAEAPLSVSITSASSGEILKWNGTAWVNDSALLAAKAPLASPTFTGTPTLPTGTIATTQTASNNTTAVATTAYVDTADALKANLSSPTFTGTPTLPTGTIATTQTAADSTTKVATTAFVTTADALKANLASPTFTGTLTANDVTVSGNLTVSGTTTSINTETLTVNDNIVVLNNNVTSAPTENAGIEVERGSSTNVVLRWNETSDKWELTTDGSNYADIATETYAASLTPSTLNDIGDVTITTPAAGQTIQWNGSAWVNITPTGTTVTTTANRSTDIPSPFIGQLIVLTDTKKVQLWDGTSWLNITMAPPETPTSLSALEGPTSVAISFTAGAANGSAITNYKYALSTDGGSTYGSFTALSPADFTTPITVSGLSMNTAYYVKLKAVNDLGDSVASAAVTFTTEGVPATPTSLSASNEGGFTVDIAFTAGATNGASISNYKYAVSTDNVTYSAFAALSPADFTTPVTVSGLTSGTLQYIKLKAVNSNGDSAASAAVSFTTLAAPSAPTSLSASNITSSNVDIAFTAGSQGASAITNYQYALSTDSGSTYGSFTALNPVDATTPITITGLTSGTAYYIKLKAVSSVGAGAESSAVSFSTSAVATSMDYLVAAGGGGGGGAYGGYGGAGGLLNADSVSWGAGTYAVTVAGAGSHSVLGTYAGGTLTALAGGNGGMYPGYGNSSGGSGGSGGGGGSGYYYGGTYGGPGGAGTAGQGNAGGAGIQFYGGSGGGPGAVGGGGGKVSAGSTGSAGLGLTSSISGTSLVYSGGNGSPHGGGDRVNGGGGGYSGVVIIRYANTFADITTIAAGLTYTLTNTGGYKIYKFTAGTGNITFS